ncbi:MAG: mechanosensitive ion channel family protein [Pseudomonadota bacterium]
MTPEVTEIAPPSWLPSALHGGWEVLAAYPLILAAVILFVGLTVAVIGRACVMHWGGKLTSRTRSDLDEKLLRIGANVAALLLAYASAAVAVQVIGFNDPIERTIIRILMSLLILRLMTSGMRACRVALSLLSALKDRFKIVEERTLPLFDLIATIAIVGLAAYALLMVWDIDPTAWLASAGVVGIAVGFAARDTLANLFAGFFIIADAPYKMGDYIVLESGERGAVTKVGIRSTRILTRDDVEITVPNSVMANAMVYNESGGKWVKFRIRLKVGVAYGSDVDQVVALLENLAKDHAMVCNDPSPRVRMRGLGDSSLDFELLCWVNHPSERGLVSHQLYMEIYKSLGEAGIEIPFPQRDVWMRQDETS